MNTADYYGFAVVICWFTAYCFRHAITIMPIATRYGEVYYMPRYHIGYCL